MKLSMTIISNGKVAIMRRIWWFLQRRGFEVRRTEQWCWQDQARLAGADARTVFDVGASSGGTAEQYLSLFPDAIVHSFEPIPDDINRMRARFQQECRVVINECAMANYQGMADFNLNAKRDTSSLLGSDTNIMPESYVPLMATERRIKVQTKTVDTYCEENDINHIDVLKMDVQGGELGVLEGAVNMLASGSVGLVYTEVFFSPMYQEQPLFGAICANLATHGYRLHSLYNVSFNGFTGRIQWADAIFVSPGNTDRSRELLRVLQRPG